jgi:hypothetical protein
VLSRVLVLYRLLPQALARILPRGLEPRQQAGYAVGTACYTRLGAGRLFRGRSAGSEHLAYRFAVLADDEGGPCPATWIARRDTSSWIEARGARLLRADYHRSEFQLREEAFGLELSVSGERGEEFYLRGEAAGAAERSLFPNARALEDFLESCGSVRPADIFHPETDQFDLEKSFAPEPLTVFAARSAFFTDPKLFPPGTAELDSAWRLVTRRLEVAPARVTGRFRPVIEPGQGSPALPPI